MTNRDNKSAQASQLKDDHSIERDAGTDEMGNPFTERSAVLCRTCMRPLTWETRTEPGYLPRTGWYDDARSDPLVCFKAADYRHVPLTAREWAYYEAGRASASDLDAEVHNLGHELDRVRDRLWRLAALAGWRPGNPADNEATAELYVTTALNARVTSPEVSRP